MTFDLLMSDLSTYYHNIVVLILLHVVLVDDVVIMEYVNKTITINRKQPQIVSCDLSGLDVSLYIKYNGHKNMCENPKVGQSDLHQNPGMSVVP